MTPKKYSNGISQEKISRIKLRKIINKKNSLILLSKSINWKSFEIKFNKTYNSKIGRPGINTRLMVSLHYLKYTYNLSDKEVLERWVENPYWQHFSGMQFFVHTVPIHSSSMTRWRERIGELGVEELLKQTIETGLKLKIIKKNQLEQINVDTTVQEKYIRFPTDFRLCFRTIQRLVKLSKKLGIKLKQNYIKLSTDLLYKQIRYMHTKQFKKVKSFAKKLRKYLNKIIKVFKYSNLIHDSNTKLILTIAEKLYFQKKYSKNKIYSIHAPEVECISKGKIHKKYEFGNKVSIAATSYGGWVVGTKSFHDNPYDGHTLNKSLEQIYKITKILQNIFVDMGYKGHNYLGKAKVHISKWNKGRTSNKLWQLMKRRSAIEPTIGHLKSEHRMNRNRLKGKIGNCINAILSATGMNFKKLLNAVFFYFIFLFKQKNYLFCIISKQ